jgi:hypothetical protein
LKEPTSSTGSDYLYGVPIFNCSCGSSYRCGAEVQAGFLRYLVDLMMRKVEGANFALDGSRDVLRMDEIYGPFRQSLTIKVVERVGGDFRVWMDTLAHGISQQQFAVSYGGKNGPENIYREVFPNLPIAEFCKECLDGVDVSAGGLCERQAAVRALLAKCLDL